MLENPPGEPGAATSVECAAWNALCRKRKLSCGRRNREDPETRKERKQELEEMERLSRSGEDKAADRTREAAVEITRKSRGLNIDDSLPSGGGRLDRTGLTEQASGGCGTNCGQKEQDNK